MSRSAYVSLAHRYWNFAWDGVENQRVYGDFASPEGIGSNFRIELNYEGADDARADAEPDLELGLRRLERLLDHRALFIDVPEFKTAPSTLEAITRYVAADLRGDELTRAARVTLHEDERRWCAVDHRDRARCVLVGERVLNLTLVIRGEIDPTTGLALPRGAAAAAVARVAPRFTNPVAADEVTWAHELFRALKNEVTGAGELVELDIALGGGRTLNITSDRAPVPPPRSNLGEPNAD